MNCQVSEKNDVVVISLSGKIMGGPEAGEINELINNLIDKNKKKVVIDLENVGWMNSSGLGILIGAVTTLKNNGGKLIVANVSGRIENLLKITKLSGVFDIEQDVESAIEQF